MTARPLVFFSTPTTTTVSASTTIKGENNKYKKYYGIRTHMN